MRMREQEQVSRVLRLMYNDCCSKTNNRKDLAVASDLTEEERIKLPHWNLRTPIDFVPDDFWHLLQRRWFRRLWVVQEIVLAKIAFCFYEQHCLPWTLFSLAIPWIRHRSFPLPSRMPEHSSSAWSPTFVKALSRIASSSSFWA